MDIKYYLFLLPICLFSAVSAQQISPDDQYLVNRFSLSPAYAGYNESFEAFMLYRQNWVGVPNAPRTKGININGAITKNMGIGGSVKNDQTGIFNNLSASLAYSYNVSLSNTQSVRFGLSAGFFENHIDLSNTKQQDQMDPVVLNNQALNTTVFDASAGVLYRYKSFNAGISVPRLLENKIESPGGSVLYTLKRHYIAHFSYDYALNRTWQLDPIVVLRKTENSPMLTEASLLIKYMSQVWLSVGYKSNNSIGIGAGILYKRAVFSYIYGFSSDGIAGTSSGSHEISLGFLIGKNKNTPSSIFSNEAKQAPYYNLIEQ